jgi:hypothetical protein
VVAAVVVGMLWRRAFRGNGMQINDDSVTFGLMMNEMGSNGLMQF